MPRGLLRCGIIAAACCCRETARAWSRWRPRPRRRGFLRNIRRCCILSARAAGRTRRCSPRYERSCCRTSSATAPSRLGLSMIPACPSMAAIRSASPGNIAGNWASRTIARWRYRCRWPTITPVCRWRTVCICQKTGRQTMSGAGRWAFRTMSYSKQNRKLHSTRSVGPARRVCRARPS